MARSKGPVRCSFCWRGIVIRLPCRRRDCRTLRRLYALAPTTRRGRRVDRPPLGRWPAPLGMKGSQARAACRGPGGRTSGKRGPAVSASGWTAAKRRAQRPA